MSVGSLLVGMTLFFSRWRILSGPVFEICESEKLQVIKNAISIEKMKKDIPGKKSDCLKCSEQTRLNKLGDLPTLSTVSHVRLKLALVGKR